MRIKQAAERVVGHSRVATPAAVIKKKPRRYRPGTVALKQIRNYQKSFNVLLPGARFVRMMKEISERRNPNNNRWQAEGLLAIQEVAELFIVRLFTECCALDET